MVRVLYYLERRDEVDVEGVASQRKQTVSTVEAVAEQKGIGASQRDGLVGGLTHCDATLRTGGCSLVTERTRGCASATEKATPRAFLADGGGIGAGDEVVAQTSHRRFCCERLFVDDGV